MNQLKKPATLNLFLPISTTFAGWTITVTSTRAFNASFDNRFGSGYRYPHVSAMQGYNVIFRTWHESVKMGKVTVDIGWIAGMDLDGLSMGWAEMIWLSCLLDTGIMNMTFVDVRAMLDMQWICKRLCSHYIESHLYKLPYHRHQSGKPFLCDFKCRSIIHPGSGADYRMCSATKN